MTNPTPLQLARDDFAEKIAKAIYLASNSGYPDTEVWWHDHKHEKAHRWWAATDMILPIIDSALAKEEPATTPGDEVEVVAAEIERFINQDAMSAKECAENSITALDAHRVARKGTAAKSAIKSSIWHEHNADGSERATHCCGCWNFAFDEGDPTKSYAKCNECGEKRQLAFVGIITEPGLRPLRHSPETKP